MQTKWISHRGESFDAPENTIPAFALSLERGTDGMECDIHFTADGFIVCSHDDNTRRTGGEKLFIGENTLERLQNVDVCNGKKEYSPVRIPLFADTLAFLGKGREYFVEIKNGLVDMPRALVGLLEEKEIPKESVTMISFDREVVRIYKELYPDRKALFLIGGDHPAEEVIEILKSCKADGVDIGKHPGHDKEYVQKIRKEGFSFAVWTVDDIETAAHYLALGADAITSNRASYLKTFFENQK